MSKKRSHTVDDLERSLASGELFPVYLLVGEEQFLRHRGRNLIHDAVVNERGGTVSIFNADDPLEGVLKEVRGDSLFAARRMVELMEADAFLKQHGDALVRYLERPSASAVLVIDATKVDGRTRLPGVVRSIGMLIECPSLYEEKLPPWVRREVSRRGRKISGAAVSLLVDEVGSNLFALSTEIDKLITYLGERERIEPTDVAQLTGHTRSWIIWTLTDALGRRDVKAALRILEDLLREGSRPEALVGMLNWQITRLWRGRCLLDKGGTRRDVAAELRVGGKFLGALTEQIGQFTQDHLARISRMLLEADVALKSTMASEKMVLERFLVEACGATSVAGRRNG